MKMQRVQCCAECGEEGGVSLKTSKACISVKYCNAICQKKHWPTHKKDCKRRAAEIRDEALFKDPPPKEDCPICFLPMPIKLVCCVSLPPATISSVPICEFADAHQELASERMEQYYPCCGKSICAGCAYSLDQSGNMKNCPFCNSDRAGKTDEEDVNELTKRADANDAGAITALGSWYLHGVNSCPEDRTKAIELMARAADLGSSRAHFSLGCNYDVKRGDLKKAKFHYEAAAMAGHEVARHNLGVMEYKSGNMERSIKHCIIAASAGDFAAMGAMRTAFDKGMVSRDAIDSALTLYNNSCAEMRSEARDTFIRMTVDHAAER
jgi:hypothetical protein